MKHLIIGAGNMGKRYAGILKKLGQKVKLVDIEFNPKTYQLKHDSVLICTPAETHNVLVNVFLPSVPVFCEKPLLIKSRPIMNTMNISSNPSLISANWIFCEHLKNLKKEKVVWLDIGYPTKDVHWQLDLIHFWPWFIRNCGEPISMDYGKPAKNSIWLSLYGRQNEAIFAITNSPNKYCFLNQHPIHEIHEKPCNMFIEQMEHWINVLKGKEQSVNPIKQAWEHTRKLINVLAGKK